MKKKTCLLFIVLFFIAIACNKIKTEYWENGNKMSEITYSGKTMHGKASWWYQNGNIQMQAIYKKGKPNGIFTRWHVNGQKEMTVNYTEGNKNELEQIWDDKGNLLSEINYKDDSLFGKYKLWYPNGIIKLEAEYYNGLYQGEWKSYNDRGFVIGRAIFNKGSGIQYSFDLKGNTVKETMFTNNLREGKEIIFNENGLPETERYYQKGKLLSEKQLN